LPALGCCVYQIVVQCEAACNFCPRNSSTLRRPTNVADCVCREHYVLQRDESKPGEPVRSIWLACNGRNAVYYLCIRLNDSHTQTASSLNKLLTVIQTSVALDILVSLKPGLKLPFIYSWLCAKYVPCRAVASLHTELRPTCLCDRELNPACYVLTAA
jgi:hypothetical protein